MNIRPSTSNERRQVFNEILVASTSKISQIETGSVLEGVGHGIGKLSGKLEIDVMLALSQLYPDLAFGEQLDQCAENFSIAPRLGELGSSTYVRLTATPGTTYLASTHIPSSTDGIVFNLANNVTIGSMGFAYVKVDSVETGSNTNVDPLTISKISPAPAGHQNIINEYKATGGQDIESDELFRKRIKDGANILARSTISMLEQIFISINPKVLRVFHNGTSATGKVIFGVATVNGSTLNGTELKSLLEGAASYFSLKRHQEYGNFHHTVELRNVEYLPIDISFRCKLVDNANPDQTRREIQNNISRYIDHRFFDATRHFIDWTVLYNIVKNAIGMEYLPDKYFYPRVDRVITTNIFPRVRSFLMRDLEGNIMASNDLSLSSVYYPNMIDAKYLAALSEMPA